MVEVDANTDLVHLTRSMQHDKAAEPQVSPPPPPPGVDYFASVFSQGIASASQSTATDMSSSSAIQAQSTESNTSPDTFRQTRFIVTLGLVLFLIVVWILQNRKRG